MKPDNLDYITFGKYKGTAIHAIPSDYLTWLLEQSWLESNEHIELYEAVEHEIEVRDRSSGHFYSKYGG